MDIDKIKGHTTDEHLGPYNQTAFKFNRQVIDPTEFVAFTG